ncbi:MAG: hypothetical protein HUU21_15290 [Polyangiaceae bacterium]|nr:hypothetical protein [Polyangiaceae bacterium]
MKRDPSHSLPDSFLRLGHAARLILMAVVPAASGCAGDNPNCLLNGELCVGDHVSPSSPAEGSPGGASLNPGRAYFAKLEPALVSACGPCHEGTSNTAFLRGPDRYKTVVSWPGIVVKDPATSKLLTYPTEGSSHPGAILEPELRQALLEWLTVEAEALQEQTAESTLATTPRVPISGYNSESLGELGAPYSGMGISFFAEELSKTMLRLTNIQAHSSIINGVKIVHPVAVVHPVGGEPDPDPLDSLAGIDISIAAGASGVLTEVLILSNWSPDAKLSIAFETIELQTGTPDVDVVGCKDLSSFIANAEQQFLLNCSICHGGGNPDAAYAVDMTQLGVDSAAACAQIRNRVNPNDPLKSHIFVTTNPEGNASHPYKFGGDGQSFIAFRSAVSIWIQAEK